MKQMSLGGSGFERKTKRTRKREFLDEMNLVVPWAELVSLIAPHAPAPGAKGGRPPFAVEAMLRIHFLQQWFNLSDPAMEEALYDMALFREFVGLDAGEDNLPDESTILRFRHLLEAHNLSSQILATVNATLAAKGLLLKSGTVVDATLIAAPSSTKNSSGERDPEMHQTKKGNQWHFGLKAHIGADSDSGAVHSVHVTAANESDVANAHHLLHGDEKHVHADAGFTGVETRDEVKAAQQQGWIKADVNWHVAERRHKIKVMPEGLTKELTQALERVKAQIRARVEHPFHIVKNLFGHKKLRYRGLVKNGAQLTVMFALANLVLLKRPLLTLQGIGAP